EIEPGLAAVPPRVLEPALISPPEPHAPILWALSPPPPRLPIRRRSPPQSTRAPSSPPCRDLGRRGRARGRLRLVRRRGQPQGTVGLLQSGLALRRPAVGRSQARAGGPGGPRAWPRRRPPDPPWRPTV